MRLKCNFSLPHILVGALLCCLCSACGSLRPLPSNSPHLQVQPAPVPSSPRHENELQLPVLPRPGESELSARFSIAVSNVPVAEFLAALARDARLNLDIHPGVSGQISLYAQRQTVQQILQRAARLAQLRIETKDRVLSVFPEGPYLEYYAIDYVNLARQTSGAISASTQITSQTGATAAGSGPGMPLAGSNISSTRIENQGRHQFWESLEKSIRDLLRETDKTLPEGSSETSVEHSDQISAQQAMERQPGGAGMRGGGRGRNLLAPDNVTGNTTHAQREGSTITRRMTVREAVSVIAHPESGIISVRATSRQHEKVRDFIAAVMAAAKRQVMIEATVVEVELADAYRQGIEWSRLREDGSGFSLRPPVMESSVGTGAQPFVLSYLSKSGGLGISSLLNLLRSFGETKVLSSPRLAVMNNQTALLKVVENFVYFQVRADTTATTNVGTTTAVSTTPQSVSVGLVMSVTPQIAASGKVMLNVRPSISSIAALKEDPNPAIPPGIKNYVPQIRVREIESMLSMDSGEIAVLGGLMEDAVSERSGRIPVLGDIPLAGELFTSRSNSLRKSELVILLRPLVQGLPGQIMAGGAADQAPTAGGM